MTARPTIASPLYPVISAYGSSTDPALGVDSSNLVRYAVGQPTVVDPNSYVADWSYDEDTGTLQVEYNAIASQIGPVNAPHFQWQLVDFSGASASGVDANGDGHFWNMPIVTDILYSGAGSDRPSVGIGLSRSIGSLTRAVNAVWNKTGGSTAGASLVYYQSLGTILYSGLDTAPSADSVGAVLSYEPRAIYNFDGTTVQSPRAMNILPDGGYDSGQEATANIALSDYLTSRYLDLWLGAAEWSGGSGSVPGGETISMTVAAITLPLFPRFLGSNFIKQP